MTGVMFIRRYILNCCLSIVDAFQLPQITLFLKTQLVKTYTVKHF